MVVAGVVVLRRWRMLLVRRVGRGGGLLPGSRFGAGSRVFLLFIVIVLVMVVPLAVGQWSNTEQEEPCEKQPL